MFVDLAVMVGAWVALVLGLLVWAVRRVGGDMSDELTERERWLMREAWAWGQFSKSERSPAFGQTFSQWIAQAEDRLREQAPQSKIRIDAMDAWAEEQGTGIDEGEA